MDINIHFGEQDWQRIERDWTAWWVGELERPLTIIESWDPAAGEAPGQRRQFVTNFPLDTALDDIIDYYQTQLEQKRFLGDAWPTWWPNFGPGIAAAFLGAQVSLDLDTVWFEPADERNIEALRVEYDAANFWWERVRRLTDTAVSRWGDQVSVGHTDIGGNLDILASLYGTQELALAFYDDPESILRLSSEITQQWLRYYDELYNTIKPAGRGSTPWAPIWSPQRTYMLQCDFSYMISPRMFERFVLPDLALCCDQLDHAFYHLDGPGEIPHLDMLLSLENLRGIQWIPGAGNPAPEEWLPLLKRIQDGGKLCQLYVTPQGALAIARELGGRGFAFCIQEPMTASEVEGFLRELDLVDTLS